MSDYNIRETSTTSKTTQTDQRQFAEGGSNLIGEGSQMVYPTSVSVFGSPGSDVGDISFISHAPAPIGQGLSDQLSGIISGLAGPSTPATPAMAGTGSVAASGPNYVLYAAIAAIGFLVWRKMK